MENAKKATTIPLPRFALSRAVPYYSTLHHFAVSLDPSVCAAATARVLL